MIIRFKEVDEAYLKSLFHFIPKAEYDLVSGIKFPITDSEITKAKKAGFLPYHGVNIPIELVEENPTDEAIMFGKEYIDLLNCMSEKFIHSKEVVDALYPGVVLNKNVLLFGKGGHGKSEMTELFLEKAYELGMVTEKPFVQAFGEGLTEEALFGGLEMKLLQETGEYLYLVENSFMNHEVVVLEELFDAPAQILLSMKDIMTSGYFRKGHQTFKIKTKVIIGLTNKSKEDFSEDESLEAFVQRFPITKRVEWDTYTKVDFLNLFKKVFDEKSTYYKLNKTKMNDLASIIELNNAIGTSFCSPRTAVQAAQLYAFGSSLDLISDLDKEVVTKYFKANKQSEAAAASSKITEKAIAYFTSIQNFCKSVDSGEDAEVEDEVLRMLGGENVNFGVERTLSQKDIDVVKISINKLAWLQVHYQSTPSLPEHVAERTNLLEQVSTFKKKLTKIIN